MRFEMAAWGSFFATRDRANHLFAELQRAEAVTGVAREEELILDFTGVTHVSDSFARFFVNRVFDERRETGRPVALDGTCPEVAETIAWARTKGEQPSREFITA